MDGVFKYDVAVVVVVVGVRSGGWIDFRWLNLILGGIGSSAPIGSMNRSADDIIPMSASTFRLFHRPIL